MFDQVTATTRRQKRNRNWYNSTHTGWGMQWLDSVTDAISISSPLERSLAASVIALSISRVDEHPLTDVYIIWSFFYILEKRCHDYLPLLPRHHRYCFIRTETFQIAAINIPAVVSLESQSRRPDDRRWKVRDLVSVQTTSRAIYLTRKRIVGWPVRDRRRGFAFLSRVTNLFSLSLSFAFSVSPPDLLSLSFSCTFSLCLSRYLIVQRHLQTKRAYHRLDNWKITDRFDAAFVQALKRHANHSICIVTSVIDIRQPCVRYFRGPVASRLDIRAL